MPNRVFGVVEASAWMRLRNGTFKMSLLFAIKKANKHQLSSTSNNKTQNKNKQAKASAPKTLNTEAKY